MVDHGSLAQQLYEAYGDSVGWKNYMGFPMPPWELLSDTVKDGWAAVARKAAELLVLNVS